MNSDKLIDIVFDFWMYLFIAFGIGTLLAGFFE